MVPDSSIHMTTGQVVGIGNCIVLHSSVPRPLGHISVRLYGASTHVPFDWQRVHRASRHCDAFPVEMSNKMIDTGVS